MKIIRNWFHVIKMQAEDFQPARNAVHKAASFTETWNFEYACSKGVCDGCDCDDCTEYCAELYREIWKKIQELESCSEDNEFHKALIKIRDENPNTNDLLEKILANTGSWNTGYENSGNRNTGNWNSGHGNTGDMNSGDMNTGYYNSGDMNTGYYNSGDMNTGHCNSGNKNTGYHNSGNKNTGRWNPGNKNTGDENTGNQNSGDWNSGDQNSGDRNSGWGNSGRGNSGKMNSGNWNSGDHNSGFFNSNNPEFIRVFNKECPIAEWERAEKPAFFDDVNPIRTGPGPTIIKVPYKTAWKEAWDRAKKNEKWEGEYKKLLALPNFDKEVFLEITGIDVEKD